MSLSLLYLNSNVWISNPMLFLLAQFCWHGKCGSDFIKYWFYNYQIILKYFSTRIICFAKNDSCELILYLGFFLNVDYSFIHNILGYLKFYYIIIVFVHLVKLDYPLFIVHFGKKYLKCKFLIFLAEILTMLY